MATKFKIYEPDNTPQTGIHFKKYTPTFVSKVTITVINGTVDGAAYKEYYLYEHGDAIVKDIVANEGYTAPATYEKSGIDATIAYTNNRISIVSPQSEGELNLAFTCTLNNPANYVLAYNFENAADFELDTQFYCQGILYNSLTISNGELSFDNMAVTENHLVIDQNNRYITFVSTDPWASSRPDWVIYKPEAADHVVLLNSENLDLANYPTGTTASFYAITEASGATNYTIEVDEDSLAYNTVNIDELQNAIYTASGWSDQGARVIIFASETSSEFIRWAYANGHRLPQLKYNFTIKLEDETVIDYEGYNWMTWNQWIESDFNVDGRVMNIDGLVRFDEETKYVLEEDLEDPSIYKVINADTEKIRPNYQYIVGDYPE